MKFIASFLVIAFAIIATNAQSHGFFAEGRFFSRAEVDSQFEQFKFNFNRQYATHKEEEFRKAVFTSNLEFIARHNQLHAQGLRSFTVGVNQFADLQNREFITAFNGLRTNGRPLPKAPHTHVNTFINLPNTVDWRTKGVVTPIKDQGQCGSCWAFSAVASMEGQHALKTGKLVSLSEQNLVDCSTSQGDMGCFGGWMDYAFQYVISNKGIDTEKAYPYLAQDENCAFKNSTVGATISSFVDIPTGDEACLKHAVATVGPISVAIDASNPSFQFYKSGVYDEPACSSTALDHGVTAVGYGTLNSVDYWLVKNSWGTSWGESGYIQMSRNKQNQCGIATKSSYPQV